MGPARNLGSHFDARSKEAGDSRTEIELLDVCPCLGDDLAAESKREEDNNYMGDETLEALPNFDDDIAPFLDWTEY